MKKTKLEKGITLIALIITIVVLLILAVVTIGAIRDSSIITHSQKASNDHITGQEKEKIQLALGEWQIQKNIPGNTQTFKEVIETELNGSATVSGEANEPLKITFTKTKNEYMVNNEGKITNIKISGQPTELEKYIFGEDLQGRDISEIMDEGTFNNAEVQFVTYGADDIISDIEYLYTYYIKNNNSTYKFKVIYNGEDEVQTTQPYYGLTKIEAVGERVGKTVSYDNKTWTILYDDETNGLQMISNEVYDRFQLGFNDSSITNWNSLITTADLDGNGSLDNFEKSIYSYNNAITTLNTACENLFKENGNYKNSNIVDVRCVGSNPISKNSENATPYTSENLAKWPDSSNSTYSAGIGNGKGKSTDYNYITDFDRMVALGTHIGYNSSNDGEDYWLASRLVVEASGDVYFDVRCVYDDGIFGGNYLWSVRDSNANGSYDRYALRPVVSLSSNVQLQTNETGTTDYILN